MSRVARLPATPRRRDAGRRARIGAILAAIALCCPRPAAAAEDGGTRSPFVHGAGNRALALGGAFTAVADDATSSIWNPAGLGRLERGELVASQTSLYGIDASEQFFALAWPSWRWGAAALTVHRLGVGDIEERDDRNVLLGSFDDSEMEIGLAYGRRVGDAWHLGGNAKLQRQSVAGSSDSGLGLDLGVLVQPGVALGRDAGWARHLTMGLAVRNAVEPTVRLDEEGVADPATLRLGAAYAATLFGSTGALAAVDLEKGRLSELDVRAGLEITPHPLLALRTGFDGNDLTAGVGVRWHLHRFDYAFEDNVLESVHRFGVSIGFGPTVQESRQAARRAEDEAFRAQLEETFERRRAERIEALLEEAATALAADRPDEAMPLVTTVQALDPEEPRARTLEADILAHRAAETEAADEFAGAAVLWAQVLTLRPADAEAAAGVVRCRTESNRRAERSARIRELFATALDAFSVGDLLTAAARLDEILVLAPDDAEAQAMRERTRVAIDAQLGAWLASAGAAIDRGQLVAAAELLARARALDPEADGLGRLSTRLTRTEQEARRREAQALASAAPDPPAVTPPALSKKKRREIEDLYRRGMEAMEEERTDDALKYWELVWLADPEYQDVAEFLKREYLLRGLESFSRGGLDEAIRLWEKARDVDPTDEKTLGYLSRAREQQSRTREILGEESR